MRSRWLSGNAETGVFHAQRPEDAPLEEGVEALAGYPPDDRALNLLLKAVPEQGSGLCLQRQLGHLGDHVVVGSAP